MYLRLCLTGDKEIYNLVFTLVRRPRGYIDLLLLDKLDVRGELIPKFFTYCCENNEGKIERTMALFHSEVFTYEQIHKNLDRDIPIPFIDEKRNPEGTPPYPERMPFNSDIWYEFCAEQKKGFNLRSRTRKKKTESSQAEEVKEITQNA